MPRRASDGVGAHSREHDPARSDDAERLADVTQGLSRTEGSDSAGAGPVASRGRSDQAQTASSMRSVLPPMAFTMSSSE